MVEAAINLVLKWHKGQNRSALLNGINLPFIIHPISVMKRVWRWGFATLPRLKACVTHDTKEDTDITWEELREGIGNEATDIVAELTYEGNTTEEKAEYLKSFRDKSIDALGIKIADRLDNVTDFMLTKPEYANKYFDKAELLFQAFVDRKEEFDTEVWNNINEDIGKCRDELWRFSS